MLYGFAIDPDKSILHNAAIVISEIPSYFYFQRPINVRFHNLTRNRTLPFNVKELLGQGFQYCPNPSKALHNPQINETLNRFSRNLKLKLFFPPEESDTPIPTPIPTQKANPITIGLALSNSTGQALPNSVGPALPIYNPYDPNSHTNPNPKPKEPKYDKMLYLPSNWKPPNTKETQIIDERIKRLYWAIIQERRRTKHSNNLTKSQKHGLKYLKTLPIYMAMKTDKNQGPAVIETKEYIKLAFRDHLNDTNTYQQLTEERFRDELYAASKMITNWMRRNNKDIKDYHKTYFTRLFLSTDTYQPSYMYLTAKVHKSPLKTRPIISTSGTRLARLSKWIDRMLQPIAQCIDSYISNSTDLINHIKTKYPLPDTTKIITADAVSMYTNIDTNTALVEIETLLEEHPHLLEDVPTSAFAIVDALQIVMSSNFFCFGDTFFWQKNGTAMGTPVACTYATIFFARTEINIINTPGVIAYKRFIDDGFALVNDDGNFNFEEFENKFQGCGQLKWEVNKPTDKPTPFLDAIFSVKNNKIHTDMHEKELSTFTYLPPLSAHPEATLAGLISGFKHRTDNLCSDRKDRIRHMQNLFLCLQHRGHSRTNLEKIFKKIYLSKPRDKKINQDITPFILDFATGDIPRKVIRELITDNVLCPKNRVSYKDLIGIKTDPNLIIAYKRPMNIGNYICKRKLHDRSGTVTNIINDQHM